MDHLAGVRSSGTTIGDTKGIRIAAIALLTIFVLSVFVGFEVIAKVSTLLHTPLMSGANAIHGVIVVGVMLVAATTDSTLGLVVLFLAAVFAAMNVVGGFVVTDRMLEMFKRQEPPRT